MKALAIAGVNLRRFVRDRSNIFFVFVLPLAIVILIGAQFGGGTRTVLGLYAADDGSLSQRITEILQTDSDLRIEPFDGEEQMVRAVERGGVSAGVSIPAGLDQAVVDGTTAQVGFVARPDGVGPQLRTVVDEAVAVAQAESMAVRFAVSRGADRRAAEAAVAQVEPMIPTLSVETSTVGESLFPATLGQFDIGASSQLVLFMFLTGLTGSAALIQTRQLGVSRRMLGSPTRVGTIVAGEALGRFAIVLVQGVYIMAATWLLFRVNWGDPIGAVAILVVFAAVGAAAAMLLGTVFRNDQQAGGISVVAGIGLAALGGSMMPLEFFGPTMRTISRFTPHSWANEAFAKLVRHDGTLASVLPELGVLAAIALVLGAISTWRLRRVLTR